MQISEQPLKNMAKNKKKTQVAANIGTPRTAVDVEKLVSVFKKLTSDELETKRFFYKLIKRIESTLPLKDVDFKDMESSVEELYPTVLDFPKRPEGSKNCSKDELDIREKNYFANWLKDIYENHQGDHLSYFEHNLEVGAFLKKTRFGGSFGGLSRCQTCCW
jgi:hypothetical protein